jgi:hypothetical protein
VKPIVTGGVVSYERTQKEPSRDTEAVPSEESAGAPIAERAKETAVAAKGAAGAVAADATQQARRIADEVGSQARDLYDTTRVELKSQAEARTERATESLRAFSGQVRALAEGRPEEAGPLAGLAREAEERLSHVADRLETRGVDGMLDDVGQFARRRPLVFLAACAGAGFVLGRFVRAARADNGGTNDPRVGTSTGSAVPQSPWSGRKADAVPATGAAELAAI